MKMVLKKKGTIETQFNWVFVMIAGSLILLFFFGVVQKQREFSDAKLANTLITSLEGITTGAGVSRGAVKAVNMPRIGISMGCDQECRCTYGVKDVEKDFQGKIIFSPQKLEGDRLLLWTLDWQVPFRVTNFVYATTPGVKYFFVFDNPNSQLMKFLNKSVPRQLNIAFVPLTEYRKEQYKNYDATRFIFIDILPTNIPPGLGIHDSFRKTDVGGVLINSDGSLIFYDKISKRSLRFSEERLAYFRDASLFGALFAQNGFDYKCNMRIALKRLEKVARVYGARTGQLALAQGTNPALCGIGYDAKTFNELEAAAREKAGNIPGIGELKSITAQLEQENDQYVRGSCPLLY